MSDTDPATPDEMRTPLERWGTCCPHDPECDHSYLDALDQGDGRDLERWLNTPISDEEAAQHV